MKKTLSVALILSAILLSCEKLNIPSDYPSTYYKLHPDTISLLQSKYLLRNPFLHTSLNEYGFCDVANNNVEIGTPPYIGIVSKSEAEHIIKEYITRNISETGVKNPDELTFSYASIGIVSGDSYIWHFKSNNQKVDTIEVLYTRILFHLKNGFVNSCYCNWFPEIYIPEVFNISQTKAMATLVGRTVMHYGFSGDKYYQTISSRDIDESRTDLKIIPEESTDRIELRVCWEIYVPGVSYRIYVDVMNGEIVSEESTIIS